MTASEQIDARAAKLEDWRHETYIRLRKMINSVDPGLEEVWKWNSAVWMYGGVNICATGAFKEHVKLNFFAGASLVDEDGLFNAGKDSKNSRSINYFEGDEIDELRLQKLIREAINLSSK